MTNTLYPSDPKRESWAVKTMGILTKFKEITVHDKGNSYNSYKWTHALCNSHFQKELNGIEENYKQQLAKEMNELLTEMKK